MTAGQQVALQPPLAQVLGEHLHHTAVRREMVVPIEPLGIPGAVGGLEDGLQTVRCGLVRTHDPETVRVLHHDIAQELHSSGADVTLVQRSPTTLVSIEPSTQLVYEPYNHGTMDANELNETSMQLTLETKGHVLLTAQYPEP